MAVTPTIISCPRCGHRFLFTPQQAEAYAGRLFPCSRCNWSFAIVIPTPEAGLPVLDEPAALPGELGSNVPTYAYGTSYGMPYASSSDGMAMTGFVLGLLSCVPGVSVLAILFSAIGLRKGRYSQHAGKGLAIAGLVLGIVGLCWTVYACAAWVNFHAYARRMQAQAQTLVNVTHIAAALQSYAQINDGNYPDHLEDLLMQPNALVTSGDFVRPESGDTPAPGATLAAQAAALNAGGHLSYVYLGSGLTTHAPPGTIVLYEPPSNQGNSGITVIFADGHSATLPASVSRLVAFDLRGGQNPPNVVGLTQY